MEKVVYNAWNDAEAELMVKLLRAKGIEARTQVQDFGSDVFVDAAHEGKAAKLLRRYTA